MRRGALFPPPTWAPRTSEGASSFWPTAVANDDNKTPEAHMAMKRRMKDGPRKSITSLAVKVQTWQTPRAEHDSGRHRGKPDTLHSQVKSIQVSRLHQTTTPDGPPSSANAPTSRPRLNPDFTDWLMNLVPGWTDCVPLAMPLSCDRQPRPLPNCAETLESEELTA